MIIKLAIEISLIRNGFSKETAAGKMIGRTDSPLSAGGADLLRKYLKDGIYPQVSRVYTGAYKRCRESAAVIFAELPALLANGLIPFDYGDFEGVSKEKMKTDPRFAAWASTEAVGSFPGGEDIQASMYKNVLAFDDIVDDVEHSTVDKIAIVTHRNVISAVLNKYLQPDMHYLVGDIEYGRGFTVQFDTRLSVMRIKNAIYSKQP